MEESTLKEMSDSEHETLYRIDDAIARMMKLQDENDKLKQPSYTWVPLICALCSLFYMHGMALGWYTCPK